MSARELRVCHDVVHGMRCAKLVVVGAFVVVACGPAAPPRATAPATAPRPSAEPAIDPRLEALLAKHEAFFAKSGTAGATAQPRPPRPRPAVPAKGSVPTKRIARIEAVAFNRTVSRGPRCDVAEEPYARDGRLCEDVRLPVATLTGDEMARVTGLLDAAEARIREQHASGRVVYRAVTHCGFDPHHAFVLYDASDRPLGTIVVCISCGEWLVRPASEATGEGEPAVMAPDEESTLRSILEAHDLGASLFRDEVRKELWDYVGRVYGSTREPTPRGEARRRARLAASSSGVAAEKRASTLGREEREALCRWVTEDVVPAYRSRSDGGARGYECDDHTEWLVDYGERACAERPLPCDRSVGELEACLRDLDEPQHLCVPAPASCAGLLTCLPGFRRQPKP